MLTKKNRLTKRQDFKKVFVKGKRSRGYFFVVQYLGNNLENSRFAVVASTKVSKKATKRNKLKRQTREIIRLHLLEQKISTDFIVNILPAALNRKQTEVKKDLLGIFQKIKFY